MSSLDELSRLTARNGLPRTVKRPRKSSAPLVIAVVAIPLCLILVVALVIWFNNDRGERQAAMEKATRESERALRDAERDLKMAELGETTDEARRRHVSQNVRQPRESE